MVLGWSSVQILLNNGRAQHPGSILACLISFLLYFADKRGPWVEWELLLLIRDHLRYVGRTGGHAEPAHRACPYSSAIQQCFSFTTNQRAQPCLISQVNRLGTDILGHAALPHPAVFASPGAQSLTSAGYFGGYITFLGFHPYKEVVFLSEGLIRGLAYHLNTSKVQELGNLFPTHYGTCMGIQPFIEGSFPYTPWIGEFP